MRLSEKYKNEVMPAMKEKFAYKNDMAVPKIEKVIVNTGFGRQMTSKTGEEQKKWTEFILGELAVICGQKAVLTKAKKAISSFKLRKGMAIGCKVTLRRDRMYDFFDKVMNIALPRIRDFKGVSPKSFDGRGNYNLGLKEQVIFPEINYDKIDKIRGMDICIVTTGKSDEEAKSLLRRMGMPFKQ